MIPPNVHQKESSCQSEKWTSASPWRKVADELASSNSLGTLKLTQVGLDGTETVFATPASSPTNSMNAATGRAAHVEVHSTQIATVSQPFHNRSITVPRPFQQQFHILKSS